MRKGWAVSTLAEVCRIKPPKKEARERLSVKDHVSFVPMRDMGIGEKNLSLSCTRPFGEVIDSYTYFANGDVLLAKITPCFENGKLGIARGLCNGAGFGSSEFVVFRPTIRLDSEYLFYFLSQDTFRRAGAAVMSGAVGHKRVPKEFIENYPIPIPPLVEQKRIGAILDEAFAGIETAIANTEKNLANAHDIFESYLNSMFRDQRRRWQPVDLESHVRFIDYRGRTPKKTESGLRLITAKNVRMGFLRREPEEFINPVDYEAWMTRGIPQKGDVLFTTEAPLGLVCQLNTSDRVAFAQRIIVMQPDRDAIRPEYLGYALRSPLIQAKIHDKATGATATGIKSSLLKKIEIPLTSMSNQNEIVGLLQGVESSVKELEHIYQRKLNILTELRQSLLQKAFSGELTADRAEREVKATVA